jgi:hypothetical protein
MSSCFQAGIPDPPHMSASLIEQKQKERVFLEQLLDAKKLQSYTIPVPIKAELRKYQQVSKSPTPLCLGRAGHKRTFVFSMAS